MADQLALCREPVVLTLPERALLRSLHPGADLYDGLLSCALEEGHGREHAARAQDVAADDGPQRWLRWWPGRRVLDSTAGCGILGEDTLAPCSIVPGHEGAHSFDLAEPSDHTLEV